MRLLNHVGALFSDHQGTGTNIARDDSGHDAVIGDAQRLAR
jgi:hypothetical protein